MTSIKNYWKGIIHSLLKEIASRMGMEFSVLPEEIVTENPPKPELGDLAFPMFPYAKILKQSPQEIAKDLLKLVVESSWYKERGEITATGPYVNLKVNLGELFHQVLKNVRDAEGDYGRGDLLSGQKIMVEFSCPNTNKPLHLGHLRNDALGESVSRILKFCGAEVSKVNLINDRGIHICKSMLAYKKFGDNITPEETGIKSDHFVGNYYVKYNDWLKEDPTAEEQAREMLRAWERGDEEVNSLWQQMNQWAIGGIQETYKKTGISFDRYYYESKTYTLGREEVLKGLAEGAFYRDEDGSIWVDLSEINLDKKVLLRKDGTSLYLTQDIGTAISRHKDWPFNRLIYVVASEQQYHFKVLFYVLEKLGYPWAEALYHLSYGMVNLPEGRMKSREGTVVDADDLLQDLVDMARQEIFDKGREKEVENVEETARSVALGALNYYLLQATPSKDMIFNPQDSISFNGNTGPYLQYMGARISSMLRKYQERKEQYAQGSLNPSLLITEEERTLIKLASSYPEVVKQAAEELNPSILTSFLYEVSKVYSKFYHDSPILHNEDMDLVVTRVALSEIVLRIIQNTFSLLGIPFLSRM